jgi:hypothetical protein
MRNRKRLIGLGIAIPLVGLAAFVAGRLINAGVGTVGLAGRVSIALNEITPAPELPPIRADVSGLFVERQDNVLVVQAYTFGAGVGGLSGDAPMDEESGTRVEVVVTSETEVYRDVTVLPDPVNGEIHGLQQAAGDGDLSELNPQTFLSVWGRRSGDRVIAEVLFYSNPRSIKKPGG